MPWWDQFSMPQPQPGPQAGGPTAGEVGVTPSIAPMNQPSPGIMPGAESPPIPPAPVGADPVQFRKNVTDNATDASKDFAVKGQAAREFLSNVGDLESLVRQAPEEAFGTWAGSPSFRAANKIFAAIPGEAAVAQARGGTPAQQLGDWQDRLAAKYAQVGLPKIKEYIGAVPRAGGGEQGSFVTQSLSDMAINSIGGLNSGSKQAALDQLGDAKVASWDRIGDWLHSGTVRPSDVLSTATNAAQGKALGRGAFFLNAQGQVRRNPVSQTDFDNFYKQ